MGMRRGLAVACRVLGWGLWACAVALCALTVILCFNGLAARLDIVGFVVDLTRALPELISGYGVIATPFGGVFRLDFALMAALLFALDWACARGSRALMRTRG